MKISLLTSFLALSVIAACGSKKDSNDSKQPEAPAPQEQEKKPEEKAPEAAPVPVPAPTAELKNPRLSLIPTIPTLVTTPITSYWIAVVEPQYQSDLCNYGVQRMDVKDGVTSATTCENAISDGTYSIHIYFNSGKNLVGQFRSDNVTFKDGKPAVSEINTILRQDGAWGYSYAEYADGASKNSNVKMQMIEAAEAPAAVEAQ